MNEQSSDLADDIVPKVPEHIDLHRDFQPWHKIRKQYIRDRQWNNSILRFARQHLKRLQTVASRATSETDKPIASAQNNYDYGYPLTCLLIPGDDLLDLRSLHKYIESQGYRIKYLGFNKGHGSNEEGTRLHIANNAVTSLKGVVSGSQVIHDSFQAIARRESMAYRYLANHGPFHIINLDICDSLFPNTTAEYDSYYHALVELATYQMDQQTTPWLLFVTTQVEPGAADTVGLSKLCGPARQNCDSHPNFSHQLGELLPITAFQCEDGTVDFSKLDEAHMTSIFGVAFGKWLLSLAVSAKPMWTVTMLPGFKYVIRADKNVEMLSLGFHFHRHPSPPVDTAGMSSIRTSAAKPPPDELTKALEVVSRVSEFRDVDDLLRNDPGLNTAMETASADLMESAGFDRAKYIAWARSQGPEFAHQL